MGRPQPVHAFKFSIQDARCRNLYLASCILYRITLDSVRNKPWAALPPADKWLPVSQRHLLESQKL